MGQVTEPELNSASRAEWFTRLSRACTFHRTVTPGTRLEPVNSGFGVRLWLNGHDFSLLHIHIQGFQQLLQ